MRRIRVVVGLVALLSGVTVWTQAGPAGADVSGSWAPLPIPSSQNCANRPTQRWRGVAISARGGAVEITGTIKWCFTKFRLNEALITGSTVYESDPTADYYAARMRAFVTFDGTLPGGRDRSQTTWQAPVVAAIRSNATGLDSEATANVTGRSCSTPIQLGLGGFGVSFGFSPTICRGTNITLTYLSTSMAMWASDYLNAIPTWDTVFIQKVRQGIRPSFTFTTTIPVYTGTVTASGTRQTESVQTQSVTF